MAIVICFLIRRTCKLQDIGRRRHSLQHARCTKIYIFFYDVDVDECANVETNDCDLNALCTNTEGSYVCRCLKGYEGDGKNCTGTARKFPKNVLAV